jgi:hypothetical protein
MLLGELRLDFSEHSCHDVTLLSLLYGIGTEFVAIEDEFQQIGAPTRRKDNGEERWKYWPEHATTLNEDNEYFVRILLNGKKYI